MMSHRSITWIKIKPWLSGVLLSIAAMFLGYNFGSEIARLLGGEPRIWARLGKGFVWGGVIACLQWPIIGSVGVHSIWFITVSAVGFTVGYPFGQTIQSIILQHWGLHMTGYWLAVATFGLFLSVPQWWIFRRHLKHASLWILFNMLGWILTGVAWISFGANCGVDCSIYGIITGLGLVWLVHSKRPKLKTS